VLCLYLLAACSDSTSGASGQQVQNDVLTSCADTGSCVSNAPSQIDESRPARVLVPSNYTATTRYPLIVLLHGFGANGVGQAAYLGLIPRVDTLQYVLVYPNGTENPQGERYWNATPTCCAPPGEEFAVDDVAYIRSLIAEAAATYSIDVNRIGLIGHSNGAAMTLRMVCEASDLVTAAVSLAGWTFPDDKSCTPAAHPVSILTLHGDADETIFYDGGEFHPGASYPGALETIRRFAAHAQCDVDNPAMAPKRDVDALVDGPETEVLQYRGCPAGIDAELWTMVGSTHVPGVVGSAVDSIIGWIIDHPRSR
jgi:polyhydroxybutyrate depolymerase